MKKQLKRRNNELAITRTIKVISPAFATSCAKASEVKEDYGGHCRHGFCSERSIFKRGVFRRVAFFMEFREGYFLVSFL